MVDFSFMRNAYFPTGAMLAAMRFALPELIADYGSAQPILNEKLSYFLRCDRLRLQVLHGASQIFPILARIFAGSSITIPTATFGEYSRLFPDAVPYLDAPGVDWGELGRNAPSFRIVVIVNPNTSTGTTLSSHDIHVLARATPDTLFWVDESFLAFSDQPSIVELLQNEQRARPGQSEQVSGRSGAASRLRVLVQPIPDRDHWRRAASVEPLRPG